MHKIDRPGTAETNVYNSSCSNLSIGIKISNVSMNPAIIDPNKGFCITRCTFVLSHIIHKAGDKLQKPTKEPFYVFSFDGTEEKVAMRFEGEKSQDAICEITLCQCLNPENELPIGRSIRFLCVAHPV